MVHRLYILILLAVLMAACSSDDVGIGGTDWSDADGMVTVGLRFSAAGSGASTRAWQDSENATDDEMMNLWTVVVADAAGNVQAIHACKPTGATKPEVDDYVNLTPGIYTFYSFANMAPSVVMQLLGISGTGATGGEVTRGGNGNLNFNLNDNTNPNENPDANPSENPDANPNEDPTQGGNEENANPPKSSQDDIASKEDDTVYEIAFDDNAKITVTPEAVKVGVDGNNFNPEATDNGFGAKGIPMCNVQTKEITSSTTFDLIVVRMMAKMELQITNETGAPVTIKSATLSNVTQNDNGNLKLLPSLTNHDTMEPTHKDIQPNLGTAAQGNVTVAVNKDVAVNATETVTFYVNESATPANAEGLFYLTLEMDNSGTSEYRYALISNNANEWNYIARNDYRKIPIGLDDLKFEIIPYDFPPIGVYPCSVKEVDAVNHIYDFQFHDYGHFHLLPKVTKGGAEVEFSATTPTSGSDDKWTLINNDFAQSWFTAAAFGDASWMTASQITATGFYRNKTAIADGDEVGGEPYWYVNDGAAGPQWAPDAAAYRPFIFGYIADPETALGADKKIYHEMRIQVYNGTTAYRQMLYRFYMTLSDEQMLYAAPAKGLSVHRRSHFER
ncbi:MAG: hypothetical protein IKN75_01315 [Prevotella sp.]|nr:hypothetical protein [Prevotella sp.]